MHMNDGRVVSNFILQALQNESITVGSISSHFVNTHYNNFAFLPQCFSIQIQIYGHGKQTRSFQYVSDLVDGLVALMNSSYTLPINLGNPIEHNIDGKVQL